MPFYQYSVLCTSRNLMCYYSILFKLWLSFLGQPNLLYEHFKIIAPLRNMILDQLPVIFAHLLVSSPHAVIHEQSTILLISVLIKHPISFGHILLVPLI